MPRIRMYENSFAFWSLIALIFCLADVSCQRRKCLGTSRYCPRRYGKMRSVCREGYCVCTGQDYDYNTCLPNAYGCRIEINSNEAVAKPQYNNQPTQTIYSCTPGNFSTQYEVHVMSVYEGNRHTRPPSAGDTNVNIVSGGQSGRPIVLVFASYEPVNWILHLPAGITISRVILVAYYADESSVTGDVNQVQRVRRRGTRDSRWRRGYGNDLGGGDTVGLLQRVYNRFGVVTSFTGTYKADEWSLVLSSPRGSRLGFFSNGSLATIPKSSSLPTRIQTNILTATATHTAISTSTLRPTSTSTSTSTSTPTKTHPIRRIHRPILKAGATLAGRRVISKATPSFPSIPTATPSSTPTRVQTSIQTSISTSTPTSTTTATPKSIPVSIIKPMSSTLTPTPTSRATQTSTHIPTSMFTPEHIRLLTLERHRQRCYTFSNHSSHCFGQYGEMKSVCKDGYCVCTGQDYDYHTCLPNAYGCRMEVNTGAALAKPQFNSQAPHTIYSCTPDDSSPQYEVHVLSVYEVINRHPPSAGDATVNIVSSGRPGRPIVLVLGSYEPVNWILNLPPGITISKVILVAYYLDESSVSGDMKQVIAVERKTIRDSQWSLGYGSDSGGEDTVGLLRQVYNAFGVVTSFTGTYRAEEWSLVLSSSHGQASRPVHVAATPVGPTENDDPKPRPWILIAVYTVVVVLLTISFTVLFIWCRRRKSRKDTDRSRAVEEAAHYNYIFDEIKGNSSHQPGTATHYVERTLPPCPRYQSVDPSTKEPAKYERRNSEIHVYEELDFRRLSDGQDYENLRKIKVDVEYLELVGDPRLPIGNAASYICNDSDGGKVDADGYLEPVNADKDLPVIKSTYHCKVDHEYFELEIVSDTDLHCGN